MSQSYCLHDEGEESWPVKLHFGCGGIYLAEYINIDAEGNYAIDLPEEVTRNTTNVCDYYARLDGSPEHLPQRRRNIVDQIANVVSMEYPPSSVDKIIAIQLFEHLSPCQSFIALRNWHSMLKTLHPLVLSIPDMYGSLEMIKDNPVFAFRHLIGRRGDYLNTHHAWYTNETFCELLNAFGFKTESLPNFHFHPAIVVRALKQ